MGEGREGREYSHANEPEIEVFIGVTKTHACLMGEDELVKQ